MASSGSDEERDDKRKFGEYRCPNCNRMWCSANSWVNYAQKCTTCKIDVFAFKLTPLEKSEGLDKSDPAKRHPQDLCEKCIILGYFCGDTYLL